MKRIETTIVGITAALVLLLAIVVPTTTTVYGQTTTPATPTDPSTSTTTTSEIPLSTPAQQIIADAQTACSRETGSIAPILCVSVIHESPNTVVLYGQLLVFEGGGYADNPFIWRAVDGFRGQGYTLTSAQLSGQGSQGNPHSWYIVMSK
jgi:hypothetical protein